MVKQRHAEPLSNYPVSCFLVFGRKNPTESDPSPKLIVSRVYAKNELFAESKFWKINRSRYKLKKANGRVLKVQQVFEDSVNTPQNYGIFFKYRSHVGWHNSYKEFRALSLMAAMDSLYSEMASNHSVRRTDLKIVKTNKLEKNQLKTRKPRCLTWINPDKISFPVWKKTARKGQAKYENVYTTQRPTVYTTGKSVDL